MISVLFANKHPAILLKNIWMDGGREAAVDLDDGACCLSWLVGRQVYDQRACN